MLLLDEPFSALDAHLRFQLEREMLELLRAEGKPTILVSHDRDEVFRMSERIAVMNRGFIDVQGDRDTVFRNPHTPTAARLTGCKNISPCQMRSNTRVAVPDWGMELTIPETREPITHIGIRMHDVCPGPGENHFACTLVSLLENPFSYVAMLKAASEALPIGWEMDKATWQQWYREPICVSLPPEKLLLLSEPRKDRL